MKSAVAYRFNYVFPMEIITDDQQKLAQSVSI